MSSAIPLILESDKLSLSRASSSRGVTKSTWAKPGPIPPPVVGLHSPAASPNSATLAIIGRFTMPLGMGPQNLPTSLHSEKRSAQRGSSLSLSSNCSQDSPPISSGLLHVPILVVSPEGIAHAKKPGDMREPVYMSRRPSSP